MVATLLTHKDSEVRIRNEGKNKNLKPLGYFLGQQANRGFARSRLCTDEDGTTNYLVLYMVRSDTSKKGGDAPRATD